MWQEGREGDCLFGMCNVWAQSGVKLAFGCCGHPANKEREKRKGKGKRKSKGDIGICDPCESFRDDRQRGNEKAQRRGDGEIERKAKKLMGLEDSRDARGVECAKGNQSGKGRSAPRPGVAREAG